MVARASSRREEVLGRLTAVVDEGRGSPRATRCTALTAEGLVGAAFGIVYARLLKGQREPLTELLAELMGMIVLPYLGPAAARREQDAPAPRAVTPRSAQRPVSPRRPAADPLESVPMRLTYRTSRVLEGVAELANRGPPRAIARSGISRGSRIPARSRSSCGVWSAWGCWPTAARGTPRVSRTRGG